MARNSRLRRVGAILGIWRALINRKGLKLDGHREEPVSLIKFDGGKDGCPCNGTDGDAGFIRRLPEPLIQLRLQVYRKGGIEPHGATLIEKVENAKRFILSS